MTGVTIGVMFSNTGVMVKSIGLALLDAGVIGSVVGVTQVVTDVEACTDRTPSF
jgi:hypothetical protein